MTPKNFLYAIFFAIAGISLLWKLYSAVYISRVTRIDHSDFILVTIIYLAFWNETTASLEKISRKTAYAVVLAILMLSASLLFLIG